MLDSEFYDIQGYIVRTWLKKQPLPLENNNNKNKLKTNKQTNNASSPAQVKMTDSFTYQSELHQQS